MMEIAGNLPYQYLVCLNLDVTREDKFELISRKYLDEDSLGRTVTACKMTYKDRY